MVVTQQIQEGKYTETVYRWIADGRYQEAIELLGIQLQMSPGSQAALSLLGYCFFQVEDYENATAMYEQLAEKFPHQAKYKMYHALSLAKTGHQNEALRGSKEVEGMESDKALLGFYVAYNQDDFKAARKMLTEFSEDDAARLINEGCILYKEEKYEDAKAKFAAAMQAVGERPFLLHNIALCHYKTGAYGPALQFVAEIIERGVREHPELGVGSHVDEAGAMSVGNSQALRETALVEAFNLKAAIEYDNKQNENAVEALQDMPPRDESELDPVTLHNHALIHFDDNPAESFRKLNHLLQNPPYPPEAFANLLLLYCNPRMEMYEWAADVLAGNEDLVQSNLAKTPDLYDFLNALIARQSSPEEGYDKLDALRDKYVKELRGLIKTIQDSRQRGDQAAIKRGISRYDHVLEQYIPVLMGMAHVYWDIGNYAEVDKCLQQSAEFCSEHEVWKLNAAHVCFMKEEWKEAIKFYEPIVRREEDTLRVPAIVLGNLCVAYIMTSQNEHAEELMKRIERDEERIAFAEPKKRTFHHCIVNMVIGTLYCAKGNFEFGIARVIKSLDPLEKRLSTDTWMYAKQCLVAMADNLAKHMIVLKDEVVEETMRFLDEAEKAGRGIATDFGTDPDEQRSVATEARILKHVLLKLQD
ncbi:unnamed protein product [Pedinophyceae sp. YPF-701]|nr:unnamed protein product [Pedinophyceae sp. YPF-701]